MHKEHDKQANLKVPILIKYFSPSSHQTAHLRSQMCHLRLHWF
jgi:hypothetical protein